MIITRLSGGMGNQMFQYAFGRVLSLKHGVPLKLNIQTFLDQARRPLGRYNLPLRTIIRTLFHPKKRLLAKTFVVREYMLDVFTINAEIAQPEDIPFIHRMYWKGGLMLLIDAVRRRILLPKGKERTYRFNEKYLSLGKNAYLIGEWQSPKYFAGYENIIRADFSVRQSLGEEIEKYGETIRSHIAVCLHVRRKDFVGNPFHDVGIDHEYYTRGVEEIRKKVPIDMLYVFSDDIAWCESHLSFKYPVTFVADKYAGDKQIGHFWLMQQCKHFVIANSSYSWWAAWLNPSPEKVVIAPKQWFTDPSINTTDLIPPEWIRI